MHEIGQLRSQYTDGNGHTLTVAQGYDSPQRWDRYEQDLAQARGFPSAESYHDALTAHMREHGQGNPLSYGKEGDLVNGHHRYYAARDLGWTHIAAEPWRDKQPPLKDVPGWDR
jgi:hypothetical protein